jgi:hypothetical protein
MRLCMSYFNLGWTPFVPVGGFYGPPKSLDAAVGALPYILTKASSFHILANLLLAVLQ